MKPRKLTKALKRLGVAISSPLAFFITMVVCLIAMGWCWYQLGQRYDLSVLTSSEGYVLGVVSTLTYAICGLLIGGTSSMIIRRLRPTPLPVDPDNPPMRMLYIQGEGGEPAHCFCHGWKIENNTEVLYWPQPAKFVCAEEAP